MINTSWDRSFTKNSLLWLDRVLHGCSLPVKTEMWPIARAIVGDTEEGKQLVYVKGRSRAVGLTLEELDALKTSVTAIEEARRLIRDKGGRLLVVFAPTAFRVYHDIADFKEAGDDTAQWELNDLPDRFRRMISEISPDIGYLDLTSALKSAARNDTLVFLPDDTH